VSKKTIAFTMPTTARGPRDRGPVVLDGLTGESVPFVADEQRLRDAGPDSRTDEWVRDRPAREAAEPPPVPETPQLRALAVGASLTINLAAERNLMEAMTLSFMLPFALGWFWWSHAIARRQRLWGV
jgi:hypothetical protein